VGSPKPGHTHHLVEDETVERIRRTLGNGIEGPDLRDDAAVLALAGGGPLVLSVDTVVDGVHVDLDLCRPSDVGWKSLMGAVSDLAAMGAQPVGALVALCVPGGSAGGDLAVGVMAGVAEAAEASRCGVVGGDLSSAAQLVVTVAVLGTVAPPGVAVGRDGARAGDVVLVTGPCGGSAAGLREMRAGSRGADGRLAYRRPVARVAEGELARLHGAHAMMDVSDGLALDLHRLADASGVGLVLGDVPIAEGATLEEALGGGEDYELVLTIAPGAVEGLLDAFAAQGLRTPSVIGSISADPGERRLGDDELPRLGWQHPVG
jgi:thiamine-monophosphate kinase